MGPKKILKINFIVWTSFINISKYMMNQRLKIHLIAFLDLLNKINGSECYYGSHKLGLKKKAMFKPGAFRLLIRNRHY